MLKLRALEIADLPYLYQWENDAAAWCDSDTHNPLSQHLLRDYIESSTGDIYKDGQLRLVIEVEQDASVVTVGCVDLFDFDARTGKAAIGMYLAPEHRGKGYGREALRQLETYAFSFLHLHQLYAIIGCDNAATTHIYEQVDYRLVAQLPDWIRRANGYVSAHVYSKINDFLYV